MRSPSVAAILALLAVAAAACTDVEVAPFPAGQGQKKTAVAYPAGPYGVTQGTVINNFAFSGFYAPATNADPTSLQPINLGDFYNPSGMDAYPASSPYAANAPNGLKPTVIVIDIGASWCSPCQHEAQFTLPPQYAMFHPQGAEFLMVLADGPTIGISASGNDLKNWTTKFKTTWPSGVDPDRKFVSMFGTGSSAYPINIMIDARTMKVIDVKQGEADQLFFDELAMQLAK